MKKIAQISDYFEEVNDNVRSKQYDIKLNVIHKLLVAINVV